MPVPQKVELRAREGVRGTRLDPITLNVYEAGPKDGPAVVLSHGFPELAFSWRHQIAALADAGFHVLAPDQRGYGGSDRPEAIEDYDVEHLAGDLVGLLDAFGIEQAVYAGHDWGGFVVWAMPVLYPSRTAGVIGVNTPYSAFPSTKMMRLAVREDEKLYILWFQKPGIAEALLDRDARLVFEKLMRKSFEPEDPAGMVERAASGAEQDANPFRRLDSLPTLGDELLDEEEMAFYVSAFETTGFGGGINWYRNIDRNAEAFPEIGTTKLDLPCLMVTAEWDLALPPRAAEGMPTLCSDLEIHLIEKCGHWTQQEKPAELNRIMLDWLARRFGR